MAQKKKVDQLPQETAILPNDEVKFKYVSVSGMNDEQNELIHTIRKNDFTFAIGCAGSGKTHIACGLAAQALSRGLVDKIILTRPQIASEDAGAAYLPGTAEQKISPYLRPLFVELSYYLDVKTELGLGTIEIVPIAYARGLTFKNAFVICDEFQNMNFNQLRLILTRFGTGSKMVFSGDITQSDLSKKENKDCLKVLDRMSVLAKDPESKISIIELVQSVRHPIIERIEKALTGV